MRSRRHGHRALVAGVCFGLARCSSAPQPTPPSPLEQTVTADVSPLVSPTLAPDHRYVGISVAVVTSAGTHFFNFGRTSLDNTQGPTETTIFEVASITKVFTSLILANEVIHGRMNLDDPIAPCAPNATSSTCFNGTPMTYLHLASHFSGLPRLPTNLRPADSWNPYADYTEGLLLQFMKSYSLTREPGTAYEYSNLAVGLLGQILSQRAGLQYESLVVRDITSDLRLSDTRITLSAEQQSRFAPVYAGGLPAEHWDFQASRAPRRCGRRRWISVGSCKRRSD